MGEPITIYDAEGVAHTLFGAARAAELVASGRYAYDAPEKPKAEPEKAAEPEEKPAARKGKAGK